MFDAAIIRIGKEGHYLHTVGQTGEKVILPTIGSTIPQRQYATAFKVSLAEQLARYFLACGEAVSIELVRRPQDKVVWA